jgi:hypothetical protein
MIKFLILTNSADNTSDTLVRLLKHRNIAFFRWNIDLWQQYEIQVSQEIFSVTDPIGHRVSLTDSNLFLLWRKPFVSQMTFENMPIELENYDFARAQIGQWLQAVVAKMTSDGRVRLIEPYGDRRLPKLFQLLEASAYFAIPSYLFSVKTPPDDFGPMMITKPLGDPGVGPENIFYTTYVNGDNLFRPYPWFVQEAIVKGTDVTCVYMNGRCHFFECDFVRSDDSIDWRTEINTINQSSWHQLKSIKIASWSESVERYMARLGLHYGRLDFICQNDDIYFLECNSNGQFGWLDDPETVSLHHEFLDAALDSTTEVSLRSTDLLV